MRNRASILILASLGALSSCGGGSGTGNGSGGSSVINVAGNWQFTANSTPFDSTYTATGQVNQNGSSLSGNLTVSDDPCAQTANFSGTINGTNLSGTLDENGQIVTMMGTVSADGNSGTGTYAAPAGGCTNGDYGTIVGQRLSMVNGMFAGTFGPANSIPGNIVAQLHDGGGQVSGTVTTTNSLCFRSLHVSGTVSGYNVVLNAVDDEDASQEIDLHGPFDQRNKSLELTYAIAGGSCSGQSGTAQLRSTK